MALGRCPAVSVIKTCGDFQMAWRGLWERAGFAMALNGKRLISVYDPEADRVEFQVEEDLAPGEYRLDVPGRDRCGNETRTSSSFRVR